MVGSDAKSDILLREDAENAAESPLAYEEPAYEMHAPEGWPIRLCGRL